MLKDEIQELIHKSLKNGEKERVDVLRFLLSQIQYKEINSNKEITDEETVGVLRSELKKRREAIEMFEKGKRADLVEKNLREIKIIEEFLPTSMPDEEIIKIIDGILKKSENPVNPGKIIGMVVGLTKGKADGAKIASLVNQKLKKQ